VTEALSTAAWRKIVAYWQAQRRPTCEATRCLLPGVAIRYTGKRGPDSLDVGHKVLRAVDDRTVWQVEDTRPEHARCNRAEGARVTNLKRSTRVVRPATASRW
jgi:hypothetical protein